jgi:hypothetical protein
VWKNPQAQRTGESPRSGWLPRGPKATSGPGEERKMLIQTKRYAARASAAMLVMFTMAAGPGAAAAQEAKPDQKPMMAKGAGDMSGRCKAMMAGHEKMMKEMSAADQRLDGLVAKMAAASGDAKADATAAVVTEMVSQRKTMREGMMKMMHEGMEHMMEHMQAGKESMAMCPMMSKMGGMKH